MLDNFNELNANNLNDENLDMMSEILLEEQIMNNILAEKQEARLLSGKEVAAAIMDDNLARASKLRSHSCNPTLHFSHRGTPRRYLL